MSDIIREAGWPIFPTMAFGLTALLVALRHGFVPQRSLVPLVVGLSFACLLMGLFGTTVGLMHSIGGTRDLPPDERWIVLFGLSESLNNLTMSIFLVLPTTLAAAVGSWRLRTRLDDVAARSAS